MELVDSRPGMLVFTVRGALALATFAQESGGHRWQRVPPTEKRGRVHTSTVTVAVLREPPAQVFSLDPKDVEFQATRGSGPGGQHRNKVASAVILKHRPTGITVRCESERSQHQNRELALSWLRAKVWEQQASAQASVLAADRRGQVGSGMRGDKRRTIRCQDGSVVDHLTGQRWPLERYLNGEW